MKSQDHPELLRRLALPVVIAVTAIAIVATSPPGLKSRPGWLAHFRSAAKPRLIAA